MLRGWLRSRFSASGDVDDIVQESYARVLRARTQEPIESPKAFLFCTARNLALTKLRHMQVTGDATLTGNDLMDVLDESVDVRAAVSRTQELELLTQAIQSLPTRCRQILTLRKIYGQSQKQVAAQLGISENTVEAQGTIALRKLGEFFKRHDRSYPYDHV